MALGIPQFTSGLGDLIDGFKAGTITKAQMIEGFADLWTQYDSVLSLNDSIQALLAIKAAMIEAARLIGLRGTVASTAELPAIADEGDGYILQNPDDALHGHLFVRSVGLWIDFDRIVGPDGKSLLSGAAIPSDDLGAIGDSYVRVGAGVARLYGPKTITGWGVGQDLRGPAGPSVEIQKSATAIQWRVTGAPTWVDLVPLVDLHGPATQLRTNAGMIQWRPVGASTWTDLIALAALEGASAYETWLAEGNAGSPSDFVAALKGATGASFTPSAIGLFSGRAAYNASPADFSYLASDQGLLYFRVGGSGWSAGIPFGEGKSAYQVALDEGYVGTASAWLATLHGKNAYELAVDAGFVGDMAAYLAALHGGDGDDGAPGPPGADADTREVLRLSESTGRVLLALSKLLKVARTTPDGKADHFGEASGVNAAGSTGEHYFNAGANDYYSNTAPAPAQIPTFTGATSGGYTAGATSVSDSSHTTYAAWKAFDGNDSTSYISAGVAQSVTLPPILWVQQPTATTAGSYTIKAASDFFPVHFEFVGSNDGAAWTVLDSRTGITWTTGQERTYPCTAGVFSYYGLRVIESTISGFGPSDRTFGVAKFTPNLIANTASMTLVSAPDVRADVPDFATIVIGARAGSGSLTPNTDIVASISRDGGGHWSTGVLETQETDDGWTHFQATSVDLSAQPPGSSMVWKIETTAGKEVRIDDVWLRSELKVPTPINALVAGWTAMDVLASEDDLPDEGERGAVYLVGPYGANGYYDLWVWLLSGQWFNAGPHRGPPGPEADLTEVELAIDALIADLGALDTAIAGKAPSAREIAGGGLVTGGGDLSVNRTLSVAKASAAEISAGTEDGKAVTPKGLFDAADPLAITYASTIAPDFAARLGREVVLEGNVTVAAPTGGKKGGTYVLHVKQGGSGSYTASWNAAFDWGAAGAPTLSTVVGKLDVVTLHCLDAAAPKFRASINKG